MSLPSKLITDPRNAKEHYQSFIRKRTQHQKNSKK